MGVMMMTKVNNEKQARALSKALQQKLKSKGFEIDVVHSRIMNGFAAVPKKGVKDNCLSRTEFVEAVKADKFEIEDKKVRRAPKYGVYVSPTGGFTKVILKKGDLELVGKYNFRADSPYFKAEGVLNALQNALIGAVVE